MITVRLDVVPEGKTERCSLRFRPRDCFGELIFRYQEPIARQGGREMSSPTPYFDRSFRPLGINFYIYRSVSFISFMWFVQVCTRTVDI